MTILIVEDSQPMRQLLKKLMSDLTEDFTECEDGAQALGAYRQCHPDWVLMDLKMKGVDGLAATRQIKAAFPEARIIIVTGYDDARLRAAAQKAGACGYVNKENLLELRQVLKQSPPLP
jgi:two-component system, chemotaxis family, chemotaxis protein CheY